RRRRRRRSRGRPRPSRPAARTRPAGAATGPRPGPRAADGVSRKAWLASSSEDPLRRRFGERPGGGGEVQVPDAVHVQRLEAAGQVEEAVLLGGGDDALGERAELRDVLLAREGPGAAGVGVGDGELVGDDRAVLERDLDPAAEGAPAGA